MSQINSVMRIPLGDKNKGIHFTKITDKRFKVNRISISLTVKLDESTVTEYAILPFLLSKSNADFPDLKSFSIKLSELYGGSVFGDVRKNGDNQTISISASGIDNRFALENEDILGEITEILINSLLNPALQNGVFNERNVKLAISNHIDSLEAELSEKSVYAMNKALEIILENEPAGLNKYGKIEKASTVTPESLYNAYKTLLKTASIEIICVGCNEFLNTEKTFATAFSKLERTQIYTPMTLRSPLKNNVREVSEEMPISQCKMVLGFKFEEVDRASLLMFQRIYGGMATSKLFMNVREKLSLAYYCSSRADEMKGVMYVSSGVERENIEKARDEIINQLDLISKGNITDDELENAILDVKNGIASVYDTTSGIDTWYFSRILRGDLMSPDEYAKIYTNTTKEKIQNIAEKIKLDSVYILLSDGTAEEEVFE